MRELGQHGRIQFQVQEQLLEGDELMFRMAGIDGARHGRAETDGAREQARIGDAADRNRLPDEAFAFPKQRKEPLTDASHVINALARFDQVEDVSDADRDLAFANIKKAAEYYDVDVEEKSWRDLGKRPHTRNPAHD